MNNQINFNPADPSIWNSPCYAFNPNLAPDEALAKLGYDRKTLVSLAVIQELRDTVVEKGLSLFIVVDGRHRSGKSRFVFLLACLMSNEFQKNPEKFMVEDAEELLALTEDIDQNKIKNPVIIVDEAGNALNRADWQEKIHKAVTKTLTVIGYLHPTIFFCSPLRSFILKSIRDMSHVYIKVSRSSKKFSTVQLYRMSYNSLYNKMYSVKFKINFFGQPIKVDAINITLPPPDIEKLYAEIELKRKPNTLKEIREDVKKMKIENKKIRPDYEGIVNEVLKDVKNYTAHHSKPDRIKLNAFAIKVKFGCSLVDAQQVKFMVEQKVNNK